VAKHPGGRPTLYKEEYCERIVELGRQGKTFVEIANEFGVTKQTLHNWCDAHCQFFDAMKKAKGLCEQYWMNVGREGMYMGGKDTPFQANMWIFWMKACFGWSDRPELKDGSAQQRIELSYSKPEKESADS